MPCCASWKSIRVPLKNILRLGQWLMVMPLWVRLERRKTSLRKAERRILTGPQGTSSSCGRNGTSKVDLLQQSLHFFFHILDRYCFHALGVVVSAISQLALVDIDAGAAGAEGFVDRCVVCSNRPEAKGEVGAEQADRFCPHRCAEMHRPRVISDQ